MMSWQELLIELILVLLSITTITKTSDPSVTLTVNICIVMVANDEELEITPSSLAEGSISNFY